MLYQWDIAREPMEGVIESFWRVRRATDATRQRAEALVRGVLEHAVQIDDIIARTATHWRFQRIAAVDRSILRVATYELTVERATPRAVVLNEAVEMAKRFGEADSPLFVNGVLDAVSRTLGGSTETGERRGGGKAGGKAGGS